MITDMGTEFDTITFFTSGQITEPFFAGNQEDFFNSTISDGFDFTAGRIVEYENKQYRILDITKHIENSPGTAVGWNIECEGVSEKEN